MKKTFLAALFSLWTTLASAGVVCTVPFNLQNGTTADATQVMANYNAITACLLNAAAAGSNSDITALLGLTTPLNSASGGSTSYIGGTSTGSANAQIITPVVPTGFTLVAGKRVIFLAGFSNTGALQINVAGTGLINVFKQSSGGPIALTGSPSEVIANQLVEVIYDGTQYEILPYVAVGFGLTTALGGPSIATVNPPYPVDVPVNLSLSVTAGSNLMTASVLGNNGLTPSATNPVLIPFRNTSGNGGVTWIPVTAALSINTNAAGASMGCGNNALCRTWIVAFNNAGTVVLAYFTAHGSGVNISPLTPQTLNNTVAISNSATSQGVFYTPNGTTLTGAAYTILGYFESTQATAGTYVNQPSLVQLFGPGIIKPGEPIQATYCTTSTCAIIPSSAANLVKVSSSIAWQPQTANNEACVLLRGATNIGTLNVSAGSSTSDLSCTFANILDAPATTSSTTYSSTLPVGASQNFQYELEEIMG